MAVVFLCKLMLAPDEDELDLHLSSMRKTHVGFAKFSVNVTQTMAFATTVSQYFLLNVMWREFLALLFSSDESLS